MRKRKFRLYYHKVTEDKWIIAEEFTIEELIERKITWDKERCQLVDFTSLLDKNKKEVYEGDILAIRSPDRTNQHLIGEVYWDFLSWQIKNGSMLDSFKDLEIEVIGNTKENPEMVKP